MTAAIASVLLRMHPRTWRMRYEEEVRALLEDNPPTWSDVAGLAGAVIRERVHTLADPIQHPTGAALITGVGGWLTAAWAISLTARAASGFLEDLLGTAPGWAGTAGVIGLLVVTFRALPAAPNVFVDAAQDARVWGIRLAPLSTVQLRLWWAALWLSVVLTNWADPSITTFGLGPPIWFASVIALRLSSQASWQRARATSALRRLRRELREAGAEHRRLVLLTERGLAVQAEVDAASNVIARINADVRDAARGYRIAAIRQHPPDRPLGL
jgi:hypothetical protein